jgi:UDP-glucose 4-epimerase
MVLGKIGLTGATGMVGRHLQARFQKSGAKVVAVSRLKNKEVAEWNLLDWLEKSKLDELFGGVDAIVHAGAQVPTSSDIDEAEMFNANVRSCVNLGKWALERNVPLVYVSGAIVYASPIKVKQNEASELGWSGLGGFYGLSKLLAEDVLVRLRQKGLMLSIVRPTAIYGYGLDAEKMVQRFLSTASAGGVIKLSQPINDTVDLMHAADVATAIEAILMRKCWKTFNVASGKQVSIKNLADACIRVSGRGAISVEGRVPQPYQTTHQYSLDISKIEAEIGWKPEIDIDVGLEMMNFGKYLPDS